MNIPSKHPSEADLFWYAATDDPLDTRVRSVREHLAEGCAMCVVMVRRLQELTTPRPFGAVRTVLQSGWLVPHRVAMSGAGSRSGEEVLHVLCRAGPYELDILTRDPTRSSGLELTGQATRPGDEPVESLEVHLIDAKTHRRVTSTRTDAFGEFDLIAPADGSFGIRVGNAPDAPYILVWEEADAAAC